MKKASEPAPAGRHKPGHTASRQPRDIRRLSRALIALAMAQAKAEADAQAEHAERPKEDDQRAA